MSTVFINFFSTLLIEPRNTSSFYEFPNLSVQKTSTVFTNFLHPYLSDQNFSTVSINFLQSYYLDHKTLFISLQNLIRFWQFLTGLLTPTVFINLYNPTYLVTKFKSFDQFFTTLLIIS